MNERQQTATAGQRRMIETATAQLHRAAVVGERTNRMALESLSAWQSVGDASREASHRSMVAWLDATAAMVPGSEPAVEPLREAVDEWFAASAESSDASWAALAAMARENAAAGDAVADDALDLADASARLALAALGEASEASDEGTSVDREDAS